MKQLVLATALALLAVPAFAEAKTTDDKDGLQTKVLQHHEVKIKVLRSDVDQLKEQVQGDLQTRVANIEKFLEAVTKEAATKGGDKK